MLRDESGGPPSLCTRRRAGRGSSRSREDQNGGGNNSREATQEEREKKTKEHLKSRRDDTEGLWTERALPVCMWNVGSLRVSGRGRDNGPSRGRWVFEQSREAAGTTPDALYRLIAWPASLRQLVDDPSGVGLPRETGNDIGSRICS